jgi:putative transposase
VSTLVITAIENAAGELTPLVGRAKACEAVGLARATHYRRHRVAPPKPKPSAPRLERRVQPRALSAAERAEVLQVLHSARFVDTAPATVYATLLDEGRYLASISTMYPLLRERGETGDRRRHAVHPATVKPEPVAAGPNEVWSWDITKLHGPAKWIYYYLYVILDIFSRYVVGWMVAHRESAILAERLIAEAIRKQHIKQGPVDHPRRPRQLDGLQAGGVPARRPGRDQEPLPAALLERQPLLRGAVQDPEVPA